MKNKLSEIKLNLCEAYFSIIKKTFKTEINIYELCKLSKISIEDAESILPKFQRDYNVFFLKILLAKLDQETLNELKEEISYDTVSSIYEKILEGIILRFEKYLLYQPAFKILSEGVDLRTKLFCQLFKNNHSFMFDLLNIVEGSENNCKLLLKSVALNLVYSRTVDVFLKEENSNLDTTIRHLDQYLHEIEDLGYMFGIIKK